MHFFVVEPGALFGRVVTDMAGVGEGTRTGEDFVSNDGKEDTESREGIVSLHRVHVRLVANNVL
jgi:hypothetical protein